MAEPLYSKENVTSVHWSSSSSVTPPASSRSARLAGEALWEPPSTGYTKHDGALVLASGEVVTDPEQGGNHFVARTAVDRALSCVRPFYVPIGTDHANRWTNGYSLRASINARTLAICFTNILYARNTKNPTTNPP